MALGKKGPYHPLIFKYLRQWQDDPTSRVFAPLSEAYRKAGLVDEAISIAREGLLVHPNYVSGRVALARALFEKKLYEEVVSELRQIVQDVPDNLVAQRLLAESSLMLGNLAEALSAYKMLLYFAPQDHETAKLVLELETRAYAEGSLVLRSDPPRAAAQDFSVVSAQSAIAGDPERKRANWIRKVELLQGLLQRVERYKTSVATG